MSTTIQFFNCFISRNGQRTNISVSEFLDAVISIPETRRFVENQYGAYSLIEMLMPTHNPNSNQLDRIVGFASYREKKPFVGSRGTDARDEIAGDVFELTTCLFIPNYHLAVIEYNHFGARAKNIERYLNQFLPVDDTGHWSFELIPVQTAASFDDIRRSGDIRSIELKLDLLSNQTQLFAEEIDHQSISYKLLNEPVEAYREIGANVATISLSQGRHRRNPMEFHNLLDLLRVLDLESDTFASVKVKYYSETTSKVETADLKNDGFLKKVIRENDNSDAFESIGIGISRYYYEESGRLSNQSWRNHVTETVGAVLPLIERNVIEQETEEVVMR